MTKTSFRFHKKCDLNPKEKTAYIKTFKSLVDLKVKFHGRFTDGRWEKLSEMIKTFQVIQEPIKKSFDKKRNK